MSARANARLVPIAVLLGVAALGATCKGNDRADRPAALDADARKAGAETPAPALAISEIEGLDLTEIEPKRRADVLRILNDTYCYCGCPRTIAACLANKAECSCVRCSERMAGFILGEVKEGMSIEDVEAQLLEGFSEGFNGRPVPFDLTGQPAKGPKEAPLTIVEFADFRCPHCAAAYEILDELVERRTDVRLVYFYFPLGGGGERSIRAAEAAEEAHQQGKFWEMARLLFRGQHALEDEDLARYAAEAGLDLGRYTAAMNDHKHRETVSADKRAGEVAGVVSTPSLYVNGRPFGLARTVENLELRIAMESERGRCD